MNISKDGKTLYFSDEEIDNETKGEKKVFVTKRINGKESHVKAEKRKNIGKHLESKDGIKENIDDDEIFNFNSEMVLGILMDEDSKEEKKRAKKSKKRAQKNKKNTVNQTKKAKAPKKKKSKKKKKINKKVIGFFSILIIIGVIIALALTAPIFNITDIEVYGNNQITSNTIISLSRLKKGENIFKFNNSVQERIKENSYIDSVKISRKLPGKVAITVEERKIKYQTNLINSYVYIDKNGYILENSSERKEGIPLIVGLSAKEDELMNEKRLKTEDLEKINNIIKIVDASKAINIDNLIT